MTSEQDSTRTSHGWNIVEKDGGTHTIKCPECGETTTAITENAVLSSGVTCSNCGNEKEISTPNSLAVILFFIGVVIYAWILHKIKWVKNRV